MFSSKKSTHHYVFKSILTLLLFNISTIQAADLSKTTAMSMLSEKSIEKIQASDLHSLLDKNKQEFIVVFNQGNIANGLKQHKQMAQAVSTAKYSMLSDANSLDITIMDDYSMLPMMAIQSNSRQALVDIINRQDVIAVYENKKRKTTLQESLPLIDQPRLSKHSIKIINTHNIQCLEKYFCNFS